MRKLLLSAFALLLAATVSAQGLNVKKFAGKLDVQKSVVVSNGAKKAPAKALANNQRTLGEYSGNECDGYLGIPNFAGNDKVGVELTSEELAPYYGAKVVGVRFNLGQACSASDAFVLRSDGENLYDLALATQSVTSPAGDRNSGTWQTIMFDADNQFTLSAENSDLLVGYSYKQTSSNYPVGVYTGSPSHSGILYFCANIPASSGGQGIAWYGFKNSTGGACIQLIIESDNFAKNALVPNDFGTFTVALGKTRNVAINATNVGETLSNIDYTITLDGTVGAEKHLDFGKTYASGDLVELSIPFDAAATTGKHAVKFTVTKVNGVANETASNVANGTNYTLAKEFQKVSVVEECTGTGCGWCPRGHVGMRLVSEQYGDNVICMAAHMYNSTDPMYLSGYYYSCGAYGDFKGAPTSIVNRNTDIVDPYDDMPSLVGKSYGELPIAEVNVVGMFNEDQTEVTAYGSVESLVTGSNYDLAYVLLADGLKGTSNAWKQSNYYSQYSKTQINDENLNDFCDMGSSFFMTFNDVIIAHSYNSKTNKTAFGGLHAGTVTTNEYTLTMPTKKALAAAIDKDQVYVVAILTDKTTGEIINAAKAKVQNNSTAIETVNTGANAKVVARYAANGTQLSAPQKGLNILKMSDGTTRKVIVK